jgi:hypothetical protein
MTRRRGFLVKRGARAAGSGLERPLLPRGRRGKPLPVDLGRKLAEYRTAIAAKAFRASQQLLRGAAA